ncbi:hypothetical protein NUU61_000553 [Penicillium alfredii]|uniref:Leucine-rich repeat domain-containing protein n=1 Tax=Penicillium alfredii TaxID=1506179 RepID=A0A9W9KPU9_9EURO|nr:uncharacterized protein NUU61_000553 [Penicillium alfredii]KAJ5114794.1 hypothetical protein NUU61_000553 [Penicillium alfredii]
MFAKLPTEILLLILDLVGTKNDWLSLARSCRSLYEWMIPMLYTSIDTPCLCVGSHRALVHTLLLYPELAQSVRHLKLGKLPYDTDRKVFELHRHEHYESPESIRRLHNAVQNLSHRGWEETQWIEDLDSGEHRDPWLAVLLYLVPNIETLELFWGGTGTRYSEWVLTRASKQSRPFDSQRAFQSLHTAVIKVLDDEGLGFKLPRVAPFFRFPSMHTFKGQLMTDFYLEHNILPPNSSPITHLELAQSSGETGFIDLIAPCTNLRTFKFTQQEDDVSMYDYTKHYFRTLAPTELRKALALKKDTLESMEVSFYRRTSYFGGTYSEDWIGSMADFRMLRNVHIRAPNFLGIGHSGDKHNPVPRVPLIEFLPGSLETLWVSDIEPWAESIMMRELLELVHAVGEMFPHLRAIDVEAEKWQRLDMSETDMDACVESYPDYLHLLRPEVIQLTEELRTVCHERGIEFHVRVTAVEARFDDYDDTMLFGRYSDTESEDEDNGEDDNEAGEA